MENLQMVLLHRKSREGMMLWLYRRVMFHFGRDHKNARIRILLYLEQHFSTENESQISRNRQHVLAYSEVQKLHQYLFFMSLATDTLDVNLPLKYKSCSMSEAYCCVKI